jgi:DNA polymerase-3 subunit delta'
MSWPIVGHEWAVALLGTSLAAGRPAHAYLFCGPPQIGKTTLALALAQALNCTGEEPPCGRCAACLKTERRAHPDVQVVEGQGAGGAIKIEQVRALQREAALAPYEGRYRVFILPGMERATIEAANSLLKTLEEPPGQVVLALTAVHAEALPATVVSRCQRLDLRPAAYATVEAMLREKGLAQDRARLLARLSGGRVGWALTAIQEESHLTQRREMLDQLVELLPADRVTRFDFAWEVSREASAGRQQIDLWLSWWRDLLLLCHQNEAAIVNVDRLAELHILAGPATQAQAQAALGALQTTAAQLEANVNARLAWESLMLKLPRLDITGRITNAIGDRS